MFRPDQPFRKEARYTSDDGNFHDLPVKVVNQDEDEDGEDIFSIHLPNGVGRVVFADELNPRPDAPETIPEAIEHLLMFSHPICHGFVLEALGRYAEQTLADPDETRRQLAGGLIGAEAWLEAASATKAMVDRITGR